MALYLKLKKIFEDKIVVRYEFDSGIPNCFDTGIIEVDKKTGEFLIFEQMPGDNDNKLAEYAYRAVLRHWQKGEFPDRTFLAY